MCFLLNKFGALDRAPVSMGLARKKKENTYVHSLLFVANIEDENLNF